VGSWFIRGKGEKKDTIKRRGMEFKPTMLNGPSLNFTYRGRGRGKGSEGDTAGVSARAPHCRALKPIAKPKLSFS